MSNDIQKADQIAYRFYSKLCLVVNSARSTAEPRSQTRVDKWFNLETPDPDLFKDPLRIYRTISSPPPPPPFELQVLLAVPEISNNQVLVYIAPDSSRTRIDPTPQHIVLETWLLDFAPGFEHAQRTDQHPGDVAPSTIYKHGIPLFRSIYSLLRILPTWKLYKRLRRRMSSPYRSGNMSIQLRIKGADDGVGDLLDFDNPPAFNAPALPYETHTFPSIPHPMGTLSLAARYLTSPNFQLDELESLLSSRFLSLDEASDFTPTLAKNQARDSMSALAGPSAGPRTKSPPSSIAGQFILPPPGQSGTTHARTNSMPGSSHSQSQSPRAAHLALPMCRTSTGAAGAGAGVGSASALSIASSSRQEGSGTWSKEESALPSIARIRRESTSTTGRSSLDLPAAPGPLPIRRPGIAPVHPFRSSTLSSGSPSIHSPSPSLRQPSPLSTGGMLPARPAQTSPNSSRVPPSPIRMEMGGRPSPPFAPSSLSDRRSLASAEGVAVAVGEPGSSSAGGDNTNTTTTSPKIPQRKRYSSSFGHRYTSSGAGGAGTGSEGSPGSTSGVGVGGGSGSASGSGRGGGGPVGTEQERERERSQERRRERLTSFMGPTNDEDELSMFVQEIDARKPLGAAAGRPPYGQGHGHGHGRALTSITGSSASPAGSGGGPADSPSGHSRQPSGDSRAGIGLGIGLSGGGVGATADGEMSSSPSIGAGPMLTREAEVDERLKHMHEIFLASLEGLGSGSRSRRRSQTSSGRDVDSLVGGAVGGGGGEGGSSRSSSRLGEGSVGTGSGPPMRRPHLGSMRTHSAGDVASSGGSAEVIGRLELDEESRQRRYGA
ncbi:hypothetical protein ID866_8048 [Astraeus odoratus]|nr:hypothetical protein ID866_8048 [Astraeus odoratus]